MSEAKFLVTGATAATGKETVHLLLQRGYAVRALVHGHEALQKAGAEIVVGDLRDFSSVRDALEGVRAAYFVFPLNRGFFRAQPTSHRPPRKLSWKLSLICRRSSHAVSPKAMPRRTTGSQNGYSTGQKYLSCICGPPHSQSGCCTEPGLSRPGSCHCRLGPVIMLRSPLKIKRGSSPASSLRP